LKFKKKSAILWGLFAVVLILVVITYYYHDRLSEKARQLVLRSLQEALGPDVRVEEISLNLLSSTVTIKSLVFPPHKENQPPLEIAEAKIALSRLSLLTEALVIKRITLKGPQLIIIRDPNGHMIWPAIPLNIQEHAKTNQKQIVLIRELTIEDGRVTFRDQKDHWSIDLVQLESSIIPDFTMRNFEIEFAAPEGEIAHQEFREKSLKAQGRLKLNPSRLDVVRLEVGLGESNLTLHGDVTQLNTSQPIMNLLVDTDLDGILLQKVKLVTTDVSGKARVKAEIRGSYSEPRIKGNALLKGIHFKAVDVFTGKLDFSYLDGTFTIQQLQGTALGGDLSGNLILQVSQTPVNYRTEFKLKDLSLEKINPLLPKALTTTGLRLSGEIKASGHGFSRDSLQGLGWLKATRDLRDAVTTPPAPAYSTVGQSLLPISLDQVLTPFRQIDLQFETLLGPTLIINSALVSELSSIQINGTAHMDGAVDLHLNLITQDMLEITKAWRKELPPSRLRFFDLAGPLQFTGSLKGTLSSPYLEGKLAAQQVLLRGKPTGSLTAELVFDKNRLDFHKAVLSTPPGRSVFNGYLDFSQVEGPQFSVNATVSEGSAKDILSPFLTRFPLYGTVNGNFTAQGRPVQFRLQSKLSLREGSLYGQQFQKGEVNLEVTPSQVTFSEVRLWKDRTVVNGSGWVAFNKRFSAKITSDEFHLEDLNFMKGLQPHVQVNLATEINGSGDFQTPEFHGQAKIKELVISDQNLGAGQLHMTLLAKNLAFEGSVGQTQASGLLRLEKDLPIKANLSFADFPLTSLLKSFYALPFEKVDMLCSGQILVSGKVTDPQNLQVKGTFTHLSADIAGYKVTNEGEGLLEFDNGHLQIKSFRLKGEGTSLSIMGEASIKESLNLFVNGEADLDIFRLITHEFSYGKGKAYLVLKITDQWNDPKIQGGLTVQEGILRSETLGQTLTITSMGLFFNQRQILLETLEGQAGGGSFKATGKLELKNLLPDNFGLIVDLADAKSRLGEEGSFVFGGTFVFQGNPQTSQLRGEAHIQRATYNRRIDLKTLLLEIQKKREQAPQPTPWVGATKLDIHFGGKDNIWINNNVAKVPLEVDLFLKGTIDRPLLFGHVEARDGEIYFRRNVFKVQSGTLDFINPNQIVPILDLKAQTTVREYQVDMSLTGRLDKPLDLQLVSDPPLSQTDILALLTVGKTAEELAQPGAPAKEEAISIPTSVLFDEFVEEKVKELTGIDRFQLDPYAASSSSRAASGPRLTVQKRLLDDKLTVTYTSSVDPAVEDIIKLEYQLGRSVSIIGERDDRGRAGGDLKFRLEFR
jgi:autotransporter translocation and assembly factor TamB